MQGKKRRAVGFSSIGELTTGRSVISSYLRRAELGGFFRAKCFSPRFEYMYARRRQSHYWLVWTRFFVFLFSVRVRAKVAQCAEIFSRAERRLGMENAEKEYHPVRWVVEMRLGWVQVIYDVSKNLKAPAHVSIRSSESATGLRRSHAGVARDWQTRLVEAARRSYCTS